MSVAIVGQVIVSEARLLFGVGSGSLYFGPEMDKIGLAGDGEVDVVAREEIVEIDVLGLVQGDGPVLVANLQRVTGGDRCFAVAKRKGSCAGQYKKSQRSSSR